MHGRGSTTSPPRWVKAFGIIATFVVSLIVVLHLAGYGLGAHTLHSGATEHGMHQP